MTSATCTRPTFDANLCIAVLNKISDDRQIDFKKNTSKNNLTKVYRLGGETDSAIR